MALIVGVDPGGSTGICQWYTGTPTPTLLELSQDETFAYLDDVASYAETQFVVETYTITAASAKMSQQHDALEVIGVVKYLCYMLNRPFTMQTPAEAKKFSTDAKLKRIGWYAASLGHGFEGHARDASRHVLLYASKHGMLDLRQLIGA